ncbi:MAG: bifunctional 2-C-methyl-D-erythritol 4-phosphate cytidylyltransferase/2-C-methyl-D-erythritol 2,4-cyclodiphosphate synthase [Robiginitomaculum sp.]|nr:MAG: bifunctional 2-C-methyl-D-erythritol 4-phosphate cytidylyltransferase/2-C-methyl-D-erythritol 2,4-cyclodiphosphate synthase [Robiginitomaculum sp.]
MHNISSLKNDKIAILIVAAGRGNRARSKNHTDNTPKQYLKVNGETVLTKTLKCFRDFSNIIVVFHSDDEAHLQKAISGIGNHIRTVHGGATRTASVKAGLKDLASQSSNAPDYVLIHDAARPFLKQDTIAHVISALTTHQASVPVLPIVDALKTIDGQAVDRDKIVRVQTPQGFRFQDIFDAYSNIRDTDSFADDIALAKHNGYSIKMCQGDEANIKLTYENDFMQNTTLISVSGTGFDVHQICEGRSLWMCGVEIEAGFSLKGHSDADVGLHALTDALLGAIAEGDIGDHFPPSDPKWKGARSDQFLKHAANLVSEKNGIIDHIDVTVICEQPKIKPHRDAMRATIAKILSLPLGRVSVKATTTEKLGFTGRGEGIAATAIANVRIPLVEDGQ